MFLEVGGERGENRVRSVLLKRGCASKIYFLSHALTFHYDQPRHRLATQLPMSRAKNQFDESIKERRVILAHFDAADLVKEARLPKTPRSSSVQARISHHRLGNLRRGSSSGGSCCQLGSHSRQSCRELYNANSKKR